MYATKYVGPVGTRYFRLHFENRKCYLQQQEKLNQDNVVVYLETSRSVITKYLNSQTCLCSWSLTPTLSR